MAGKEVLPLLEGEFPALTARQEIAQLLQERIRYHGMQSFSNQIRFGEDCEKHEQKTRELKMLMQRITELMNVVNEDERVKIKAWVEVELNGEKGTVQL